jgi:hypothetical protein
MSGLALAKLIEIEFGEGEQVAEKSVRLDVQFNPESLRLTFANEIAQPEGGDQASGNAGRQYVGSGTTKLALSLWFDVTAMETNRVDDVRRLTQQVVYFITPKGEEGRLLPPGVRFSWGTLVFDGVVEGLEETLDFFSPDGKPLRAQVALTISQQKILEATFSGSGALADLPGQRPLTAARAGQSLQAMAGAMPGAPAWQDIALANGIEDPLRLPPGTLVDLALRPPVASMRPVLGASVSVQPALGSPLSLGR